MKSTPLISVICTVYNHGLYVDDALRGFIIQKTNFPFEVIVHDDASTDNSVKLIKEYERKYPNLFFNIYQKENQFSKGRGDVRRIVYASGRGKYIAFCEGDDYWTDPYKLQKQADILEAHPHYSFCFHNARTYFVDRDVYEDFNKKNAFSSKSYTTKNLLLKEWFIPTASLVIRKSMLPHPFPEWFYGTYSGDLALELILSTQGPFFYINEIMSVYRKNANNSLSVNQPTPYFHLEKRIALLNNFAQTYKMKSNYLIYSAIVMAKIQIWRAKLYRSCPFVNSIKRTLLPKG